MNDQKTSLPNKGWTVVIAGLSINLILGVLYAWSVIAKALRTNLHWSKTDATMPFTVWEMATPASPTAKSRMYEMTSAKQLTAPRNVGMKLMHEVRIPLKNRPSWLEKRK